MTPIILALLCVTSPAWVLVWVYLAGNRGGAWDVLRLVLLAPAMAVAGVVEVWRKVRES